VIQRIPDSITNASSEHQGAEKANQEAKPKCYQSDTQSEPNRLSLKATAGVSSPAITYSTTLL
jgi:hypothetical protein